MRVLPLYGIMQRLDFQALWVGQEKCLLREGLPTRPSLVSRRAQSLCSLLNNGCTQVMYQAVRLNKCFSSASEDHSHHLNKQIVNLRIEFPASGKMNTILDKEHLYFKEIQ